jgi:lipopolysaccharide transport system permease protein
MRSPDSGSRSGFDLKGDHGDLRTLMHDMWESRGLMLVLARKDFFVRYRRASFGVLWAVALPLLQAVVLAVVLPHIVRFGVKGSYVIFVLAGTTAWTFFSNSILVGSTAIVDGQGLTTKVYFPRLVLPIVGVLANLYGLLPAVLVLAIGGVIDGASAPQLLLLVPAVLLVAIFVAACSAVLSGLHVYFRDVRYLVQAALLVWFYVTPVVYPLGAVAGLRRWIEVNPLTGIVELFRAATSEADPGWLSSLWWTMGWSVVMVVAGLALHKRYDRLFVDLL